MRLQPVAGAVADTHVALQEATFYRLAKSMCKKLYRQTRFSLQQMLLLLLLQHSAEGEALQALYTAVAGDLGQTAHGEWMERECARQVGGVAVWVW